MSLTKATFSMIDGALVNILDFGADPTGVADSTAAFNAAFAAGTGIYVPKGTFKITDSLSFENKTIVGTGFDSVIVGFIADATKPMFKAGRTCVIRDIYTYYDSSVITGSETVGQRVILLTYGGAFNRGLQRGSLVQNVRFGLCGTGIYSGGVAAPAPFSVTFDTLEIEEFTYGGFVFNTNARTGNVYRNLYIKSTQTNVYSCFYLAGSASEESIDQLNVENTAAELPIYLSSIAALSAGTIHLEGIDTKAVFNGYITLNRVAGKIDSLVCINTRMTQDGTSVINLLDGTQYDTAFTANLKLANALEIGTLFCLFLAQPNFALYPTYPPARRYVSNIPGFNFVYRPLSFTDQYRVHINRYVYNYDTVAAGISPTLAAAEAAVYQGFPSNPHNNITFFKYNEGPAVGYNLDPNSGFVQRPDGMIEKFGGLNVLANSNTVVTFGEPFPTTCLFVVASVDDTSTSTNYRVSASLIDEDTFCIINADSAGHAVRWYAYGY